MKKEIRIGLIIFILAVIIIFLNRITDFIINVEWFIEVGYLSVYFKKIVASLILMVPAFLLVFMCIWLYYRSLRKSITRLQEVSDVQSTRRKVERRIFFISDVVISFLVAYIFSTTYWYRILQFTNAQSFKEKDPIFGLDISFYIFKLPLIESFYGILMTIMVFLIIITLVMYFSTVLTGKIFSGSITEVFTTKNFKNGNFTKFAGKQLAVVSFIIMLLVSAGNVIKALKLVYSPRGVVFGAGYTDAKISLKFYAVIAVVAFIAAIIILLSILSSKVKPIIISIVTIVVIAVLEGVISTGVQNLIVKSNERTLEAPYIKDNIKYTRQGFNLENVGQDALDIKDNLTKEDLTNNKGTIENIKINNYSQAMEFYNQTQVLKYYYNFNDIDVDRYNINGKYTQVFLSPREIDSGLLEGNAKTWQNTHLGYTHGYGVVMNKVNSVTSEGQPNFVIKNIPPENSTGIRLDDPRIYFGEKTNEYAIVDTNLKEVDYPVGGQDVRNSYNGKAGIKMSAVNRLLFALNKKDTNFITSVDINKNSKILINRNIQDRLEKIAPFLTYDSDPYMVISGGKLYWMVDAYTTSDRYPYSQPDQTTGVNYIRNSVKVIVDAVDGTTDFYIVDKTDPIVNSYAKIFPDLFKDGSSMPQDFKDHMRYPEDLFDLQSRVMGKYHVTDPGIFYNGDELWEVSKNTNKVDEDKKNNESSYMVMKLPNESKEEMVISEYLNMKNKDNMVGMFVGRMDGANYGKLELYTLPSQRSFYSPYQFKQKFSQDTSISSQLTLWNQNGSSVQYGDTVIVPVNNTLLYVESVYLRASGKQSIPEMKRVIVSYGDKTVLAESIDDAFKKFFGDDQNATSQDQSGNQTPAQGQVPSVPSTGNSEKLKEAKDIYDKAINAQKSGDWASYGDYIKKLGDILNNLSK